MLHIVAIQIAIKGKQQPQASLSCKQFADFSVQNAVGIIGLLLCDGPSYVVYNIGPP